MTTVTMFTSILIATVATLVWRVLGVVIAGKLQVENPLYQWFVHVSYAAVAAVLCLNMFVGNGTLSADVVCLRAMALFSGIVVTLATGGGVFRGLICAVTVYTVFVFTGVQPYTVFVG